MNARDFFYRYDKMIIFDTEFTTWEGALERGWSGSNEYREIVQIAAQKIDLKNETVIDQYEQLVRPRINSELSDYFQVLTGISQEAVTANGVDFHEMFEVFDAWAGDLDRYAYGCRADELADVAVLEENIALYELPLTISREQYGNLASVYQSIGVDTSHYNSGKLFQAFGLKLGGHEHNAMHDVDSLVQSLFATRRILLGSATV